MKRDRTFDYKLESELCADFAEWARRYGWTVYPETEGWDLLLVDPEGRQLGIEAKLSLNPKVIQQAAGDGGGFYGVEVGPDHRGVLVPEIGPLASVARFVGLEVFYGQRTGWRPWKSLQETEPTFRTPEFNRLSNWHGYGYRATEGMFDWNPQKRHDLPEFINEQVGGRPGPIQLTHWKVGALRVMALLEVRGWVTRKDVRDCGCDPRRFCASDGWLLPLGEDRWGVGKLPRFDLQHPVNFATILAETRVKYPTPDALVLVGEEP
jgi:hypothetical protein